MSKARLAAVILVAAAFLGSAGGGTAAVAANTWGAPPAQHAVADTWVRHAKAASNTWG